MPYIIEEDRIKFDELLSIFENMDNEISEGDLNYLLSSLVHIWIKHRELRYVNLNAAIGVLECMKLELYRQVAAPYEDIKKEQNGSVSKLDTNQI